MFSTEPFTETITLVDKETKKKTEQVLQGCTLRWKGTGLARFVDVDQASIAPRLKQYVKTHGYLAEWVHQKFPSWTEDLRVDITGALKE